VVVVVVVAVLGAACVEMVQQYLSMRLRVFALQSAMEARDAQACDAQARDAQACDAQACDAQACDAQARDAQARDAQARDAQAHDAQARDAQAHDAQASYLMHAHDLPADTGNGAPCASKHRQRCTMRQQIQATVHHAPANTGNGAPCACKGIRSRERGGVEGGRMGAGVEGRTQGLRGAWAQALRGARRGGLSITSPGLPRSYREESGDAGTLGCGHIKKGLAGSQGCRRMGLQAHETGACRRVGLQAHETGACRRVGLQAHETWSDGRGARAHATLTIPRFVASRAPAAPPGGAATADDGPPAQARPLAGVHPRTRLACKHMWEHVPHAACVNVRDSAPACRGLALARCGCVCACVSLRV